MLRVGRTYGRGALLLLALLLAGCGALGTFDALVPKDGGTSLAARDTAYGPDKRQKLDVYLPDDVKTNRKLVVFVYGGSWNSGSKNDYSFVGRALAARGFVAVLFDYRLVPEIRYPVFVQDTAKAVAWAHAHARDYGADPSRLYLMGHSAGAYNAVMTALAPEFLRAEGLSPGAIRAVAALSGPYDFLPLDGPETREAFKGVRDLPATQPINRARTSTTTPPMLLLHGLDDDFVYPRNSKKLAAALRASGHAVEEKYYPGIDHTGTLLAIARPLRNNAPVLDDVSTFFERY